MQYNPFGHIDGGYFLSYSFKRRFQDAWKVLVGEDIGLNDIIRLSMGKKANPSYSKQFGLLDYVLFVPNFILSLPARLTAKLENKSEELEKEKSANAKIFDVLSKVSLAITLPALIIMGALNTIVKTALGAILMIPATVGVLAVHAGVGIANFISSLAAKIAARFEKKKENGAAPVPLVEPVKGTTGVVFDEIKVDAEEAAKAQAAAEAKAKADAEAKAEEERAKQEAAAKVEAEEKAKQEPTAEEKTEEVERPASSPRSGSGVEATA